ncbi:RagB/SusD family nutrient uptake outer membrane protein [Mucilaginibacter limnophilus]|uniref:RagB/SusD family nutrient uptake outer membrane protein n=1 Tax=Mucilaginibacter limnophilus TaxID=1932778 RepID=A0A3S3TKC1_9SPHI|nr:RagB/SusD family nutrient uptake outer membrane protein [Mucilaginibacter limnophilus]RVU03028.1 RagB/SusD family nutrient uptake outer membrane protein [Mucilaginibacter limnophilus]
MKRSQILKTSCFIILVSVLSACKKLDLVPTDVFTDANFWTTTEKANSVLNSAYSQLFNNNYFFFNEGMSDNAYNGRGDNEGVASLAAGTYDPALGRLNGEWDFHYAGIKTTNIFLENVDRVSSMDANLKARMKAEARVLRAWHYFYLTTWFGDVPFFAKDPSIEEAKTVSRTPKSEIVNFILTELDAAAADLPVNTAYAEADRGRLTKGAAIALKARVLLYESRWADVVTECEKLMSGNNGTYSLFASYEGVFLPQNEYNSEVIFDLQYVPQTRAYSNFFDMAPLSVGARLNALAPTQELVDSYLTLNGKRINEAGSGYDEANPYQNRDPRLTATVVYHGYEWRRPDNSVKIIYTKPGTDPDPAAPDEYRAGGISSPTGYYTRKYYDPTSANNFLSGLNLIMIRYADVLLMYAEAKAELGQMNASVWNQTIRPIRQRAGFTAASALEFNASANQVEVVRNERRTELAMEGLRIFDIRRWRIAEDVLNGWAHGAQFGPSDVDNGYIRANQRSFDASRAYLWPIPQDELALNPNLGQNPGW